MNWTVEKLETEIFARVSAEGVFDSKEHLRMLDELFGNRFWLPGMPVFFDFRTVDFSGTNIEVFRQASFNRQKNDARLGCGKSAFLVKSLTDFARGRQFQLLTEDKVCSTLRIFMDERQALDWVENKNSVEENS